MNPFQSRKLPAPNTIARVGSRQTSPIVTALMKNSTPRNRQPRLNFLKQKGFLFAAAGKAKTLRFAMAHTAGNDTFIRNKRFKMKEGIKNDD